MGLLDTLYSECQGFLDLRAIKDGKTKQHFVKVHELDQIKLFMQMYGKDHDLYFGVATRDGRAGKKENIVEIPALFIDVDFKSIPGGQDKALERIEAFPLKPTAKVLSGGGIHLYWVLKEPAENDDIEQVESILRGLAHNLDGDMAATDASRILRIPNTKNQKYKPPRPVVLSYCNGSRYNLSDFDDYQLRETHGTAPPLKQTDALDLIMGCEFLQHCKSDAATLKEPDWYAMTTVLGREQGGVALIHDISKPYPKYKKAETDRKIMHALNSSGPMTCEAIRAKTGFVCQKDCEVKSPAALRFRVPSVPNVTGVTGVPECHQMSPDVTRMSPGSPKIPERNLAAEVKDWLGTCDGVFNIKDVYAEVLGSFPPHTPPSFILNLKDNIKKILQRLCQDCAIERVGSVRGVYRKVESTLEEMNWWDVCLEEYPLVLPLDLHDLCKIMPKSVIVVAGEQNAAKSAFALNIAKDNCGSIRTRFFNSEMSPEELKERLTMFDDVPYDTWRKIHFYSRTDNFHDVICPDDLNVIDYLQVNEEFWKIGVYLRAIFDRLRQGVAVVNIQKPRGRELGRGDSMSAEIARLYVSLSLKKDHSGMLYNEAKIIKAKLYRDKNRNPNGMVRNFRLYAGAKLSPISGWQYDTGRK